MLRTEPSFSIYNNPEDGYDDNGDLLLGIEKVRISSGEFSFGKRSMGLIEEVDDDEERKEESLVNGIKNLGIGGNGIGGSGADSKSTTFDESGDVEGYYKRVLAQDPSNALFLRNYAHLLQSKGDLKGAEEYYFLATLADPKDGEILLQYAKLVWELHRDQARASSYFETAARAAPEDSHVLAAYASFLWEIDDEEDEDEDFVDGDHIQNTAFEQEERSVSPQLHLAAGLGVGVAGTVGGSIGTAEGPRFGGIVEDYYKRKLKENPSNPLFLRNYAHFLSQSKGDLQGAELYYSRAMLADPGDGEVISQYAKLMWELHHDQHKASQYFERAVQAAPGDSHVLAAHAKFLWETDDEEPSGPLDDYQLPIFRGLTTATA